MANKMGKRDDDASKEQAKRTPFDGEEKESHLPSDIACDAIDTLAWACPELADLLTLGETGDDERGTMRGWLIAFDALLRGGAKQAAMRKHIQRFLALYTSKDWPAFEKALVLDAQLASQTRRDVGQSRILWGTTPIINLLTCVEACRDLGFFAESLVFKSYYITFAFDIEASSFDEEATGMGVQEHEAFRWATLTCALLNYDVFFYFNDQGILPPRQTDRRFTMGIRIDEMSLITRCGKPFFTVPFGADYRTRKLTLERSKYNFCMHCPDIGGYCICDDGAWASVYNSIQAYATEVLSSGLALAQMPGSYRLEHIVANTATIEPTPLSCCENDKPLRVLHVPNHPHFKGTQYLHKAMEKLGPNSGLELVEASGIGNDEVQKLMCECDVLVDQLIGGNVGMTGFEAMAHGRPVVCYLADEDIVLAPDDCPIIRADPSTIETVLTGLISKRDQLPDLGRRSRLYVERHYSVQALSQRLRILFESTGVSMPDESNIT